MGNSIIVGRVKGITNYYAKTHINKFKKGNFLKIIPDFDNPYDKNALAIYDGENHHIGFVDKYNNVFTYDCIKNNDYVCLITSVYESYVKPSIEYEIIYRTNSPREDISNSLFEDYLKKYNKKFLKKESNTFVEDLNTTLEKEVEAFKKEDVGLIITNVKAEKMISQGDYESAIKLLEPVRTSDNPEVFLNLGKAYFLKNFEHSDNKEAEEYLLKAREMNCKEAAIFLGKIYSNRKEYTKAYEYFDEAANDGYPDALMEIAVLTIDGLGVQKNERIAFVKMLQAAKYESIMAYYFVGIMYEEGLGTPINIEKAIYYYEKAVKNNVTDANERLQKCFQKRNK